MSSDKGNMEEEGDRFKRWVSKTKFALRNVTIEPALFLLAMAERMDSVAVKDMLLYKTCIHDFNQTEDICLDLLNETNADINEVVQNEVGEQNYSE